MNEQDIVRQLIELASDHKWYPLAATMNLVLIAILKREPFRGYVWSKIPDGWQWLAPLVAAAAGGFAKAFIEGKSFSGALVEAVTTAAVSGPIAMGYDAGLKNSKLPYGNPTPDPVDLSDQAITDRIPGPPRKPTRLGVDE